MTTENKKPEDNEEVEKTEEESTAELLNVISEAVDEVTPDDVIAANKETSEIEGGSEGADDAGETDAGNDKAGEDDLGDAGTADGTSNAKQTPEEKAAEKKAAEEKAAEEKAAEEKAAAEVFEKLTPEEKVAAEEKVAEEKAAAEAFEKLTPEEKVAAEEKAIADAAEAAAKLDPINDPIPESTKAETATRIKALIDIAKDNTLRGDQGDEIVARITATGADANQYANTLGFLELYNSKDPAMRKQALAAAEGVVRELRIELGEGSVELLDKHDDLKAEVEAGTLTEARAIEVATGREQAALNIARTEAATNKTATEQQTLDNIATGKAQLVTLENTLKVSDKEYARLRPTFIAMLRPALRKAHATEWGEVAQEIYVAVKAANPKAEKPVVVTPKHTPLRPKGSGGAGSADKTEPHASALDAVNAALGEM